MITSWQMTAVIIVLVLLFVTIAILAGGFDLGKIGWEAFKDATP